MAETETNNWMEMISGGRLPLTSVRPIPHNCTVLMVNAIGSSDIDSIGRATRSQDEKLSSNTSIYLFRFLPILLALDTYSVIRYGTNTIMHRNMTARNGSLAQKLTLFAFHLLAL